jgi:UDP-N-acetylglucosamine kinase
MAQPDDYYLGDDEIAALFEDHVRDFVFSGFAPQPHPVLSLFGAQQGAGKSQAILARMQEPDGQGLIPLSPDDLRPLHPRYEEVLATHPLLMKDATAQATTAWMAMCHAHAQRHGYGLILEGTLKDPAALLATAEAYAGNGYRVELTALAVRQERSRLDTLNRYLPAHDAAPGRWVYPDRHDHAYRTIPEAVSAAEAAPQVHKIRVTNRAGDDLFANVRDADGTWVRDPVAAEAIEAERARPFAPADAQQWMRLSHRVALNYGAGGHINDTTSGVLQRVLQDAHTVGPMASWSSDDKAQHAAVERVFAGLSDTNPWTSARSWGFVQAYDELVQAGNAPWRDQLERIDSLTQPLLHPDVVAQRNLVNLKDRSFPREAQKSTAQPRRSPVPVHRPAGQGLDHDRGTEP